MKTYTACAAALVLMALGAQVLAATPAGDKEKAKALYAEADKAYMLTKYAEAAELYKAAYDAYPEPAFLFNVAQAYRLNGDYALAIRFYKNYLLVAPDAPNIKKVKRLLKKLEAKVAATGDSPADGADVPADGADPKAPGDAPGDGGRGWGRRWLGGHRCQRRQHRRRRHRRRCTRSLRGPRSRWGYR